MDLSGLSIRNVDKDNASIRKRKFPAELVVWLLIGMGLYWDRPITEIVAKRDLVLSDTLAAIFITQVRQRFSDTSLGA